MKPMLIGHRGCKGIEPENTLLAIKKAMIIGVDGVEIDVHLSKDKELVVIHDDTLDRTTNGEGFVKNLTLKELKKLDVGKGEKIPTLQEVIDIVKDKIYLIVELKVKGTEKKVVELIKENKLRNVIVTSFIHQLVKNVKKLNRNITTGVLFEANPIDSVKIAINADADFVFSKYKWVDKEFVIKCHKKRMKVSVWNIDNLEKLEEYSKFGLDMIAGNRPDILVNYFKNKGEMKILKKTNLEAWKRVEKLGAERAIELLKKKGLTGRGGACFLTGLKWEFTRKSKESERFVICNADEGEPGTFKDKLILENNPGNVIEGILIAAYCIDAKQAYIYLRGEYHYLKDKLERVIKKVLEDAGSKLRIEIIEGAGAYICGDETAIIASIENRRGYPHFKPPYPPQKGLFGKPTIINNVETLANVPLAIVNEDWGDELRLFSLSGEVSKPGVYEIKIGTKLGEIAKIVGAKDVKAVYFGASGGCIPYNSNFVVSSDHICKEDAMLGACSLIFVSKKRSMLDLAINIAQFFKHESCGKCTPCREGNVHILRLLEKIKSGKANENDLALLEKLSIIIRDTSLCGLGQSCTNHVLTALKYFRKDFK